MKDAPRRLRQVWSSTRKGFGVNRFLPALLLVLSSAPATSVERYTEARISQVETSDLAIFVFLDMVSGDAPPVGNGGSNEPLSKPYLFLAISAEEVEARQHLLASAFVALAAGTVVRFRWDDANNRITHMLLRSN
jgi:hypothetical protein